MLLETWDIEESSLQVPRELLGATALMPLPDHFWGASADEVQSQLLKQGMDINIIELQGRLHIHSQVRMFNTLRDFEKLSEVVRRLSQS